MAGKNPAFQFYTGDWLKDPQLSMCSPATRGIWIDLICVLHELARCGQVTGTPEQIARTCRCTSAELVAAIAELQNTGAADIHERKGVYTITNRRMKAEFEEREQARIRKQRQRNKGDEPPHVTPCPPNVTPPQNNEDGTDSGASRRSHGNVTPYSSSSSSTSVKTKPPPRAREGPLDESPELESLAAAVQHVTGVRPASWQTEGQIRMAAIELQGQGFDAEEVLSVAKRTGKVYKLKFCATDLASDRAQLANGGSNGKTRQSSRQPARNETHNERAARETFELIEQALTPAGGPPDADPEDANQARTPFDCWA